MQIQRESLRTVLHQNVAEVKFQRRKPKPGHPDQRRMLCTNSMALLNSAQGRTALGFKPPRQAPSYDTGPKNLIITWDIFVQGYRTISVDSCELISIIPANERFWDYFTEKIINMNASQKASFMDV